MPKGTGRRLDDTQFGSGNTRLGEMPVQLAADQVRPTRTRSSLGEQRANGIEMCDLVSGEALAVRPLPGSGAISAGRAVPRSEGSRL